MTHSLDRSIRIRHMFVSHKHLHTYISRSIPSLYGRLDFFQFTAFSSHRIGIFWVDPKEGFHLCLSPSRAFVLPRIPNRMRTFDYCLAPASRRRRLGISTYTSLERGSTWYLCITELKP